MNNGGNSEQMLSSVGGYLSPSLGSATRCSNNSIILDGNNSTNSQFNATLIATGQMLHLR